MFAIILFYHILTRGIAQLTFLGAKIFVGMKCVLLVNFPKQSSTKLGPRQLNYKTSETSLANFSVNMFGSICMVLSHADLEAHYNHSNHQ